MQKLLLILIFSSLALYTVGCKGGCAENRISAIVFENTDGSRGVFEVDCFELQRRGVTPEEYYFYAPKYFKNRIALTFLSALGGDLDDQEGGSNSSHREIEMMEIFSELEQDGLLVWK